MDTIKNEIVDYYSGFDEWGRLDREPLEMTINWYYMEKYLDQYMSQRGLNSLNTNSGKVLDNGAGPGKYAMKLAGKGYRVTLTDLTPRSVEIAEGKAQEQGLTDRFEGFHVKDARNLEGLQDEYYDASLMLGPLYHLQESADRDLAAQELHRVTKKKGIVFAAFRPRENFALTSLLHPSHWPPNDSVERISEFMQNGKFNHRDRGRYTGAYYYQVDEIKPFMEHHGFETLELIGSTNLGSALGSQEWQHWRNQGSEEYAKLIKMLIKLAQEPSILGISSHLLYIGRRV